MNGTQESFQLYKMDENVQITSGLEKKVLTKKEQNLFELKTLPTIFETISVFCCHGFP